MAASDTTASDMTARETTAEVAAGATTAGDRLGEAPVDRDGNGTGAGQRTLSDRGVLVRYRVMAYTTAVLLLVLVLVGIPLQFVAHRPELANVVGTAHGVLYLIYLYTAFRITRALRVGWWRMALVLLAGTIPFCAFVAERKLTRRVEVVEGTAAPRAATDRSLAAIRRRWLSRRAFVLHLEVAVVAPGCAAAGWWQATRALAGNGLSWFYSVEWPLFALVAIAGWWYLIHEDPEVYRARKAGDPAVVTPVARALAPVRALTVEATTARAATALAVVVGIELALGVAVIALLPIGRPTELAPAHASVAGSSLYLLHALVGVPLAGGAVLLLGRVRRAGRIARLSGWLGVIGLGLAGIGGLLTVAHPVRLEGMAVMLLGTIVAGFGFLLPTLERLGE